MLGWVLARFRPRLVEPVPADERPAWVGELLEAIQKQSRATAKQSAKLEGTLGESLAMLRSLGEALARQATPASPADALQTARQHALLFDALDGLDQAIRLASEPHLAAGLERIAERITSFCAHAGFRRMPGQGAPPDARVMRVVGSEPDAAVAPGHVSRVVRAAILRGAELVREGEVVVAAAETTHEHMGH